MGRCSGGIREIGAPVSGYSAVQQTRGEAKEASERIQVLFRDVAKTGHPSDGSPIKVGALPDDVTKKFEAITGTRIEGNALYIDAGALLHHRTGQKAARGKVVSEKDLIEMPSKIGGMDVYENKGALIFTDYKNKYIVEVNKSVKISKRKETACCHISSSAIIDKKEFGRYNAVKKKHK